MRKNIQLMKWTITILAGGVGRDTEDGGINDFADNGDDHQSQEGYKREGTLSLGTEWRK
jgi:hypothetical protein